MTFSCIIVDDDLFAIERLIEYIGRLPSLSLMKSFSSPLTALEEINKLKSPVDFLFIDVTMPGLTGLELANKLKVKINCIILVSGHLEYAIDGYDINAKYFLGKPFSFKKFEQTINKSLSKMALESPSILINLSGKNQTVRLYVKEIILIEGASNYIKIHTKNKIFVPYHTMYAMENELKSYKIFKRISRSCIISSKHIEKVDGYTIHLKNDLTVSASKSYRKDFDLFLLELLKGE